MIAAQKANNKILVEVKSFITESLPNEFHSALGQYLDYALGLEEQEPDRKIFLAMPELAYLGIQKIPVLLKALERYSIRLIIFDPVNQKISQWIRK